MRVAKLENQKSTPLIHELLHLQLGLGRKLVNQIVHFHRESLEINGRYVLGHIFRRREGL
jgi:hypothetical protein